MWGLLGYLWVHTNDTSFFPIQIPFVGKNDVVRICNTIIFKCVKDATKGHCTKVIKVMCNVGRVQINGVVNEQEITEFQRLLQWALCICASANIVVAEPRLHLMNSTFDSGVCINLDKLYTLLTGSTFKKDAILDLSKYPGLRFKVSNVTVCIFASGKALLLGARSTATCLEAFRFVMLELVAKYGDHICMRAAVLVKKKRSDSKEVVVKKKQRKEDIDELICMMCT